MPGAVGKAVIWWEKRRDLGSAWGRAGGGGGKSRKDPKQGCPGVVTARVGEEGNSCVQNIRGRGAQEQGPIPGDPQALVLVQSLGCDLENREPCLPPRTLIR